MKVPRSQQRKYKQNAIIRSILDEDNELSLQILNHIIYLSYLYRDVFPNQGNLATKFNVRREWINKLMARWKRIGVLRYRQRGFNQSCKYFFNPLLVQERERLKWKLSALRIVLCVSSLCSAVFANEDTLKNNKNLYIQNPYQMVTVQNAGYGFYEQQPSTPTIVFFKKQQTTTSISYQPLEGEATMNKSVTNLIASSYGLSKQQEEMLSTYSDEALQYAVKEMVRQKVKPNSPGAWIASVARSYDEKGPQPKTGRMNDFDKKIVHGTMNNNHSSASTGPNPDNPYDPLNLTMEERVEFAQEQIDAFDAILNTGDSILLNDEPRVRGGGFRSLKEVMGGFAPNMKDRWKDLKKNPKSIPSLLNGFKVNLKEASEYTEGEEYEEDLERVAQNFTDPEGNKLMVRKYDYRRTARR